MNLILPYPVSVNRYWRSPVVNGHPRLLVSKEGRQYAEKVWVAVKLQKAPDFRRLATPVRVSLLISPPDRRKRDLDNCFKVLFDALTYAGVWGDDSQVHRIEAEWGPVVRGGEVSMTIRDY